MQHIRVRTTFCRNLQTGVDLQQLGCEHQGIIMEMCSCINITTSHWIGLLFLQQAFAKHVQRSGSTEFWQLKQSELWVSSVPQLFGLWWHLGSFLGQTVLFSIVWAVVVVIWGMYLTIPGECLGPRAKGSSWIQTERHPASQRNPPTDFAGNSGLWGAAHHPCGLSAWQMRQRQWGIFFPLTYIWLLHNKQNNYQVEINEQGKAHLMSAANFK